MIEIAFFAAGFSCGVFRGHIFELAKSALAKFKEWRAERAAKKAKP